MSSIDEQDPRSQPEYSLASPRSTPLDRRRLLYSIAGLLLMGSVFLPAADRLADELLSAHMAEHMILMFVAVPLLILGRFDDLLLGASGRVVGQRRVAWATEGWLLNPATVWVLFAAGFWVWHVPVVFDDALDFVPLHVLEHLTFVLIAWMFWRLVLVSDVSEPALIVLVFTTMLHAGILGVLMTFSEAPWYADYTGGYWGLSVIQDQQLAGVLMWVPMNGLLLLVMVGLGYRWLRRAELATA